MSWTNKIKKLLNQFLATQTDKYLTTEDGKKLWITDLNWSDNTKSAEGTWTNNTKSAEGTWTNNTKSAEGTWTNNTKSAEGTWTNKSKAS